MRKGIFSMMVSSGLNVGFFPKVAPSSLSYLERAIGKDGAKKHQDNEKRYSIHLCVSQFFEMILYSCHQSETDEQNNGNTPNAKPEYLISLFLQIQTHQTAAHQNDDPQE